MALASVLLFAPLTGGFCFPSSVLGRNTFAEHVRNIPCGCHFGVYTCDDTSDHSDAFCI